MVIYGEIFSYKNHVRHILKPYVDKRTGYGTIVLPTKLNKRKQVRKYIHRLVLETFVGPCPKGTQCRHLNNDKLDNRLSNLIWGTQKQNQLDRWTHHTNKLSIDDVKEIHRRIPKDTLANIGKDFNVTEAYIWRIKHGLVCSSI